MASDNKLSTDYNIRFGTLSVHRGRDSDNKPLFSWEPIPDCTNEHCPLDKQCTYIKRDGKCLVISKFVRSAAENIVRNFGHKMNNAVRNRVGTNLMPLYVILAKLYVAEAAMNSPMYTDFKGNPKMHAIYKDIRETIRAIDMQWKNLGLMGMHPGGKAIGEEEGLENYYTEMEGSDLKDIETKRKERKKQEFKVVSK